MVERDGEAATGWIRRGALLGVAAIVLSILAIDPDPRGQLAIAADLWLNCRDAEAATSFKKAEAVLVEAGVDPSRFELSFDLAPRGGGNPVRAFALLDRLARDDRAKALYRALWLARAGDEAAARLALAPTLKTPAPPRLERLAAALGR